MDWFPVVASPVLLSVLVIDVGHDSRVILLVLFLLALFEDIFEAALYRKLIVSLACPLHFLTEQRLVFLNFESSNPRRRLDSTRLCPTVRCTAFASSFPQRLSSTSTLPMLLLLLYSSWSGRYDMYLI